MAKNKKDDINSFSGIFLGVKETEKLQEEETVKEEVEEVIIKEKTIEMEGEPFQIQQAVYSEDKNPETNISNMPLVSPKIKEETRSRRMQFLLKPSVYEEAKKKCDDLDISLNECVNQLLEKWISC